MKQYKIYAKGNYIVVVDVLKNEYFYGIKKEVFVDKSNVNKNTYKIFNVKDFKKDTVITIPNILKEDGTAYSEAEFDTFYQENTGSSNGGGTVGSATEAKQDAGNDSLTNINGKIPALVGGKIPVTLGSDSITITGSVNVGSTVEITNDSGSPIPVSGTVTANTGLEQPLTNSELRATAVPVTDNGIPLNIKNFNGKLREAFQTFPNTTWTVPKQGAGDIIKIEGNAGGASYLTVSLDPLTPNTETWVESVGRFKMPSELAFGAHMSQRTLGQEISMEFVSDEPIIPLFSDIAISSIQQNTTTLTVTTNVPHGLKVGNRIGIRDVVDSRLNYPSLVIATTPTLTSFTVTAGSAGTIPSITASSTGGFVYARSAMGGSPNGTSMLFENGSSTNASFYAKSESGDSMPIGNITIGGNHSSAIASSSSIQPINAALNYAFRPATEYRLSMLIDRLQWSDVAVDSIGQSTSRANSSQVVPNPDVDYKVRFRATNNKSLTVPVAQIVSAVKSGTTTATITTDVPHGLTISDQITIYGIRDQASAFSNLTAATAVASVINATQFTVVTGTTSTVTSYGGYVARVNGGNLMSSLGAIAQTVQSVTRTSNVLTVVGSASWSGLSIGDLINLVGVRDTINGASIGIDGAYRVRDIQTTNLFLEPVGNTPTGTDIALTNCGGGVIKRTDFRLSFIRLLDYERLRVEALPRPGGDSANALPVAVNGGSLNAIGTLGNPSAPTNQFINSVAGTNIASISISTNGISSIYATNTGSTPAYIKLYNKATAPVLATDIPEMIIVVPAAVSGVPGVYTLPIGFSGLRFNSGLGIAITGGASDTDTTAVTAGQVKVKMSRNP